MKMPFGKHKGTELESLIITEPDYIIWLAESCNLTGELKTIVHKNYRSLKQEVDLRDEYIAACDQERFDKYLRFSDYDED